MIIQKQVVHSLKVARDIHTFFSRATAFIGGARLLREGIWIAAGQSIAAIATLAGVRLLTELAQPSLFGTFILLNGAMALAHGLAIQPFAQAALRLYPDYAEQGSVHLLRIRLRAIFTKGWLWILLACAIAAFFDIFFFHYFSLVTWLLIASTVGLDVWKALELVMRNAARKQDSYSVLLAADALMRPAGAVIVAWGFGVSVEMLLLGQALGGLFAICLTLNKPIKRQSNQEETKSGSAQSNHLDERMAYFAAPLLLVPLISWVSGLADRYIVGGLLGLSAAGVYAAAYGLASRPLLMVGTISDATLRQVLYESVSHADRSKEIKVIIAWMLVNVTSGILFAILFTYGANIIVHLLLAAEYRLQAVQLLPWIALGYVVVLATQVMERVLYAHHRTGLVTMIQGIGAVLSIAFAVVVVRYFGIVGVAMAVPGYFGVQFILTSIPVFRCLRRK